MNAQELYAYLVKFCKKDLLFQTRVHPLTAFVHKADARIFVKREDESGFGISGYKKRKYASLLPWLLRKEVKTVGLIGGAQSNHIVGFLQLLREHALNVHLFLKESHFETPKGNRLLLHLLTDPSEISWVPKAAWPKVEAWASDRMTAFSSPSVLLPEGGNCAAALPGAMTLFTDIIRNEEALGFQFDHIIMDAGTGFVAAANVLSHAILKHPSQLHIVQIAGDQQAFEKQIDRLNSIAIKEFQLPQRSIPPFQWWLPPTARSFGSVNRTVLETIKKLARESGILADPIYTTKLFLSLKYYLNHLDLQGNMLVIHSGGSFAISGFGDQLAKI